MEGYKNIWIFIETYEGVAKSVGLELLTPARQMVGAIGQQLVAVVIGDNIDKAVKSAAAYGVDSIVTLEDAAFADYNTELFTDAMYKLIEKYKPDTVIFGATSVGRDLAPRIAGRLQTGLTADCTGIEMDVETGNVQWTRPTFGGNLMAVIECPRARPQMGTVRPGVFKKGVYDESRQPQVTKETYLSPISARAKMRERIADVAEYMVNLEDAEIIVSGGRGIGKPENFAMVKALADALGGTVGATRAVVDAGWISHAHQVGQTGKTVGPKLYVACGISGAIQHLAGMSNSETIVAINKDPGAPIFGIADYGILGNAIEVIPALTNAIMKIKAEKS